MTLLWHGCMGQDFQCPSRAGDAGHQRKKDSLEVSADCIFCIREGQLLTGSPEAREDHGTKTKHPPAPGMPACNEESNERARGNPFNVSVLNRCQNVPEYTRHRSAEKL